MKKSLPDCPTPVLFVSVASKGFTQAISLLFATLAGRSISVAAKGLKGMVGSDLDRVPTGSGSLIGEVQWTAVGEKKDRN